MIELLEVSNIIEQYEEIHFPIGLPTLQEMIELRMFEIGPFKYKRIENK